MDSNLQPNIVQNILPVQDFLNDWHVRVTWIAFTTLWVFWGLTWFIRNAFGGDGSHVVQPNTNPNAPTSEVDQETGMAAGTNQKKFLAAPAWGAGIFVSQPDMSFVSLTLLESFESCT